MHVQPMKEGENKLLDQKNIKTEFFLLPLFFMLGENLSISLQGAIL
jgi:hypothetical protein